MGVKYFLLAIILILIIILSAILTILPEATPKNKTIYMRDLSFKEFQTHYKFENNPTRTGIADNRYTEAVYRHFEKIDKAIENNRIEKRYTSYKGKKRKYSK